MWSDQNAIPDNQLKRKAIPTYIRAKHHGTVDPAQGNKKKLPTPEALKQGEHTKAPNIHVTQETLCIL